MSSWLSTITLIPFKLAEDDRVPLFIISSMEASGSGREYGVYNLSIVLWIETLMAVSLMGGLAAMVSILTYKFVIQQQGKPISYLVGFGLILPFWIICPYYAVAQLDIRNKFMKFCFAAIVPTLGLFHTTEAMYGSAPPHVIQSLSSYVLYCGSPIMLKYDTKANKYIRASLQGKLYHLYWFAIYITMLGLVQSFAAPSHYQVFGSFGEDEPWYSPRRFLHPVQLGNNFVLAVMMQLYLTAAAEGLIAATCILTGLQCETVMANPIFGCTSPSDFWGRRWNRLVHSVLKRGAYVPLRKHGLSRSLAAAGAFLVSGIFHEWLLTFVFQPLPSELTPIITSENNEPILVCELPKCYNPPLGGSTAFMMYHAFLIMTEYMLQNNKMVTNIARHIPNTGRTLILLCIGLPVAHWFIEPYAVSNFFDQASLSMPYIREISSTKEDMLVMAQNTV